MGRLRRRMFLSLLLTMLILFQQLVPAYAGVTDGMIDTGKAEQTMILQEKKEDTTEYQPEKSTDDEKEEEKEELVPEDRETVPEEEQVQEEDGEMWEPDEYTWQEPEEEEQQTSEEYTEEYEDEYTEESEETMFELFAAEESFPALFAFAADHDITMPDSTCRYFRLQSSGKTLSEAQGTHLIVVDSEEEASSYMQTSYKNGGAYNFVPRITKDTVVTVGGGSGGTVSLDTIAAGDTKTYGELYVLVNKLKTHAFQLNKCKTNPYALYSDVGTWYDVTNNKMFTIDMRLTVTDYVYPSEETRDALKNPYKGPFVGFSVNPIGVVAMGTDSVTTTMEFFYHGTTTPVTNLKGMIQFIDIDAQQGVDLGSGFKDMMLFDTAATHLRYQPKGIVSGSVGYVYSATSDAFSYRDLNTTAIGIFEGNTVQCVWNLARSDSRDTGGNSSYANAKGLGAPLETGATGDTCYSTSRSSGFLGIDTDVAMLSMPDKVEKHLYAGSVVKDSSLTTKTTLDLTDRNQHFTYVLSAASKMSTDLSKAFYREFAFHDTISSALKPDVVKVYSGVAEQGTTVTFKEVTELFDITLDEGKDHSTSVEVKAKDAELHKESFYGLTYYLHMEVHVKDEQTLEKEGQAVTDLYEKGVYHVTNQGELEVSTSLDTNERLPSGETDTRIPMTIEVRKLDQQSKQPVKGVVFGIYGGDPANHSDDKQAILQATTDAEGIARFQAMTFYRESCGDGPYYIKEISVPEEIKAVWDSAYAKEWYYEIPSLQSAALVPDKPVEPAAEQIVENQNVELPEYAVCVRKRSQETGEELKGASFALYEWSQKDQRYNRFCDLPESAGDKGVVYQNEKPLTNTMDNLGSYQIVETAAPKGCVTTGEAWNFHVDDTTAEDGSNLVFVNAVSGKKQTGVLIFRNPLQKGILEIIKQDENGQLLSGVSFKITAAEDIYAPWDTGHEKPLITRGTVVDTITTNEQGEAVSTHGEELLIGRYTVEEVKGASGFLKESSLQEVLFEYSEEDEPYVTVRMMALNQLMRPAFSVAKAADLTRDENGTVPVLDPVSGRYLSKRRAGSYEHGKWIDYSITVTNTGNVDLYQVVITDDMTGKNEAGQTLSDYIYPDQTGFVLPDNGMITSVKGDRIYASLGEHSNMEMTLDHLKKGDAVTVHMKARIKKGDKIGFLLPNYVKAEALYDPEGDNSPDDRKPADCSDIMDANGEPVTEDRDYINIPGDPSIDEIKKANKTTGILIENGEIVKGEKISGSYAPGETVSYEIYIKNNGSAPLKDIQVKDIPDETLSLITDADTAGFQLGENHAKNVNLITANGKTVTAELVSPYEVHLCSDGNLIAGENCLVPGDYVILHYYMTILPGAANLYQLGNEILTNAVFYDGEKDVPVEAPKDREEIHVPGESEARVAKLADRTTGVILTEGRYDAEARISGSYDNGEIVTYTITVTNSGTASLYQLRLQDTMSKELSDALDGDSISFKEGEYYTKDGRIIRTQCVDPQTLLLDYLSPGDSVDVLLTAKVKKSVGNLFDLDNQVILSASRKTGSETETVSVPKEGLKIIYHNNLKPEEVKDAAQGPCDPGESVQIEGNPFAGKTGFISWNTKPDGSGTVYKPDQVIHMPTQNLDLYAIWGEEDQSVKTRYLLLYHQNFGNDLIEADEENPNLPDTDVTVNDCDFVREGYRFDSWNTKADGTGSSYKMGDTITQPAKNLNLYAQWFRIPMYSLTYEANDNSNRKYTDSQTPCPEGIEVQVDGCPFTLMKDGKQYHFAAWNTRSDGKGTVVEPGEMVLQDHDMTLYAIWEPDEENDETMYPVIYHANDGTSTKSTDYETPAAEGSTITIKPPAFYRPGYQFVMWNDKADGSGENYHADDEVTIPDHTWNLYALWEEIPKAALSYHSNNGANLMYTDAQCPVNAGADVTVDGCCFDAKGQTFSHWNTQKDDSGTSYLPGAAIKPEADTVLYAIWESDDHMYQLTYHSNLPSESAEQVFTDGDTPCREGSDVQINSNMFSSELYEFVSFNTKKDGSGKDYTAGDTFRMPAADMDLYAIWKELPVYVVSYDSNGEQESDIILDEEAPITAQKTISINENTFRKDGYHFECWNTKADGTGTDYYPGTLLKADQDLLLFAKWKEDKPASGEESEEISKVVKAAVEQEYKDVQAQTLKQALESVNDKKQLPHTELMEDQDKIDIPGHPALKVAKSADKTTGITLKDGRYEGERNAGSYEVGDPVTYQITVTNTGTSDLYDVSVWDKPDESLEEVIDLEQLVFGTAAVISKNKEETKVSISPENGRKLTLDHLRAGDQVTLQLETTLKKALTTDRGSVLNNHVTVAASYEAKKDQPQEIPVTKEMEDDDKIVTSAPRLKVYKLADKTTGVKEKNGSLSGTKQPGQYAAGEVIDFSISITNEGKGPVYQIAVEDAPSSLLKTYVELIGFDLKEGDRISTAHGKKAEVTEVSEDKIVLDQLEAGDCVVLHYLGTVNKNESQKTITASNHVLVTGEYADGSKLKVTEQMKDQDSVKITGGGEPKKTKTTGDDNKNTTEKATTAKTTKGEKTGDTTPYLLYIILLLSGTIGLFLADRYSKKKQ